jgi:hypothetical protein
MSVQFADVVQHVATVETRPASMRALLDSIIERAKSIGSSADVKAFVDDLTTHAAPLIVAVETNLRGITSRLEPGMTPRMPGDPGHIMTEEMQPRTSLQEQLERDRSAGLESMPLGGGAKIPVIQNEIVAGSERTDGAGARYVTKRRPDGTTIEVVDSRPPNAPV